MPVDFIIAPIFGYLCAGGLKFTLNCIQTRKITLSHIGMGGMPSTHNTITATTAMHIGFNHGFNTPAFSIALTVLLIVLIDSLDLRNKVSDHAKAINQVDDTLKGRFTPLKESLGHTKAEAFAGLTLGVIASLILSVII